ncbi:LysR family transcriptional regulator [Elioraea rosea]|uniref:LysR family transcriptional regulator n=1 Tax=Elioraea rosea TaxID=2492390 RepID=UPI001315A61E|nr:LysR family transcriptional regulator [Elioraea rosea]
MPAESALDLNLLAAFEALYAERSVTGAARRQGIGQPAMSAALSRLRRLLGDELFIRVGATMQPTPRAEAIGPRIAEALALLRSAVAADVAFEPGRAERRFTIAASDSVTLVLMPRVLGLLREAAPGIAIRIIGLAKDDAVGLLDRGQADVVIGTFRAAPPRLVTTTLFRDRFIGIARKAHPVLEAPVTLDAWLAWPHALFTLRGDMRGEVDDILARRDRSRRVALSLPHLLALPALLAGSDLLAAVPSRLAPVLRGGDIATFPLPIATEEWRVMMLASPLTRRDKALAWLRGIVRQAASAL